MSTSKTAGALGESMSLLPCSVQVCLPVLALTPQPTTTGGTTEHAPAERIRRCVYAQSWQCPTFAFMTDAGRTHGCRCKWWRHAPMTRRWAQHWRTWQFPRSTIRTSQSQVSIWRRLLHINHPPEVEHFAPKKLPNPNRKVVFQLPFFRGELLNCVGYSKKGLVQPPTSRK